MRYGDVEPVLIRLFEVPEGDLSSFRGKIRHLRNFNCPPIENPRAGQLGGGPAEYSDLNAFQLAVALVLGQLGVSPKASARVTLENIDQGVLDVLTERREPAFLFLFPTSSNPGRDMTTLVEVEGRIVGFGAALGVDTSELLELLPRLHALSVVNLAKLVADLNGVLQQVLGG